MAQVFSCQFCEIFKNAFFTEDLQTTTSIRNFFFLSGFSFKDTDSSLDNRVKGGVMLYSTLLFPPAREHSDIYSQLCMWNECHTVLIASPVTTRLLLDEFYHLTELPHWLIDDVILVSVCLLDDLILDICYSSLLLETGGFEKYLLG